VVDASVVVKWFVPEVHSASATRWLNPSHDYLAPDLIFPEIGNVLWKRVRDAGACLRPHALAIRADISVYDATYLALAVRLDTQVITADERFAGKMAAHPRLGPHMRAVDDFVSG
jgi:predicted nucleic acid-binding protein